MRKDVKRSLILWPAAASLTITAVSWFPTQFQSERVARPQLLGAPVLASPIRLLVEDADNLLDPIEMTDRSEHGVRAMRMPERVAEAFGVAKQVLKAPIRHDYQELAGLVLASPAAIGSNFSQLADEVLQGDMTAADRIGSGEGREVDLQGERIAESLRRRNRVPRTPSKVSESEVPLTHDPSHSLPRGVATAALESASSAGTSLNPPVTRPASALPKSNRVLGRRQFPSSAPVASKVGKSETDESGAIGPATDQGSLESLLDLSPRRAPSYGAEPSEQIFPIVVDPSPQPPHQGVAEGASTTGGPAVEFASPAGWPATTKLNEQLKALSAMALNSRIDSRDQLVSHSSTSDGIVEWTDEVATCLASLRSLPRLGDEQAGTLIDELHVLAAEGQRRAENIEDRARQIEWLRASYAVARRVAVWKLVWEVSRGENAWMVGDQPKGLTVSVCDAVESVRAELDDTGDIAGWSRYLLLDDIAAAPQGFDSQSRMVLAQRFLSRLDWHRLSEEQQRWLERESVFRLAELVRPWAQDAVDYANLMHQIELQESDSVDLAAIDVAGAVQTLRYADNPFANKIADAIDTHYRNANLRMALSADLLQRVMPEIEPKTVPVNTVVLGSRVRGRSKVETDLAIQLLPSPDRWTLQLNASGNVMTQSTGVRDAVAIRTLGRSQFHSGTGIEITPRGVNVDGTDVQVQGVTRLRSVETDYDGWPLIGTLVRSIAENRYRSLSPRANRIANRTMQGRVESEVNEMLDERLDKASDKLSRLVLGPLGRLQLDPKVTDMQTTEQRLLARFRVAGDWQMAAFTPRPRAPGSSLMSVQVHQSALNNTLEQLIPGGEPVSIRDLVHSMTETFGHADFVMPDDIPDNVTIQFSRTRPITVEIEEDRLWITLRIVRLRRTDSVDLTQFIVRAAYKPQVDGMRAFLVRDGSLRISGPRLSMRERLPARTIFNKVMSSNRAIPITVPELIEHPAMDGLAISQLELRSGWFAMAISESDAPRIALAP